MHPILFKLGFIEIRYYGLMYVVAIVTATYLIKREVRRKRISLTDDDVMNQTVWTVIGGILGARAYYVIFNAGFYAAHPSEIPAIWHGGLAIHGGLIGGILASWIFLKVKRVDFWQMADAVAPTLPLGQAFGRFGNFMNGDAHGRPTDAPWGIIFPPESIAGREFPGLKLHPTMLYEMALNFIFFAVIWFYLRKRPHKAGFIFAAYVALYSSGRFVVEHFRADSLMLGPLRAAQVLSLALIAASVFFIVQRRLFTQSTGKTR